MPTLNEAFITYRTGRQPLLDTEATVWSTKQIAGEHAETRNRRRIDSGLEPRDFTITRVPATKGHTAWTTSAKNDVTVGSTKKSQTWYGWECECGAKNPDDTADSHEDMAADKAARHIVETAGMAKPKPEITREAAPTIDTFVVHEGRTGSPIKGHTLVSWVVKTEDTIVLRVTTVSVGGKLNERPLIEAIAKAYGVEPSLVALTTFKSVAGGPRTGQGVVGDWTPDLAPAIAAPPEVRPAPAESAPAEGRPAETAAPAGPHAIDRTPQALVRLAYDTTTAVKGREHEGDIAGKAFALSRSLDRGQQKAVRSALSAAVNQLGGAYSVLASKAKTAIIVPGAGVTPGGWDAVLLVAAGALADLIEPHTA